MIRGTLRIVTQRSPDFADADLECAVAEEHPWPDRAEKLVFTDELARPGGQILEDCQRFRCDRDRPGIAGKASAAEVELESFEPEATFCWHAVTSGVGREVAYLSRTSPNLYRALTTSRASGS